MNRIKLNVPMDLTGDVFQQYTFNIPTPDGYCVKVNRCFCMSEFTPTGTANRAIFVGLAAEETGLALLTLGEFDNRAIIASGSLVDALGLAGSTIKGGAVELEVAPEPYALGDGLRALVGQAAVIVGAPTDLEVLFVVDYDVVKITTKIATGLAAR